MKPDAYLQLIRMQVNAQTIGIEQQYPEAQFWLVCTQNEPVGRLITHRSNEGLHLIDIAILTEMQGRGIFSSLFFKMQKMARPISLSVTTDNLRARALYKKLGFSEVTRDHLFVSMSYGNR